MSYLVYVVLSLSCLFLYKRARDFVLLINKLKDDVKRLEDVLEQSIAGFEMLQANAAGQTDCSEEQMANVLDSINRQAYVVLASVRGDEVPDAVSGRWDRYGTLMQS